ncbi:unnamed protein product [Sphenostylis stenocarpa]|uniref:Uncharacterized protein n=1 Tax=Sphenostylis stenocarpa TaxID=92480 RepID=A0AA86RZV9_9FABA|nr:unnamed protein product [Sphenostylis stenocarpa]
MECRGEGFRRGKTTAKCSAKSEGFRMGARHRPVIFVRPNSSNSPFVSEHNAKTRHSDVKSV